MYVVRGSARIKSDTRAAVASVSSSYYSKTRRCRARKRSPSEDEHGQQPERSLLWTIKLRNRAARSGGRRVRAAAGNGKQARKHQVVGLGLGVERNVAQKAAIHSRFSLQSECMKSSSRAAGERCFRNRFGCKLSHCGRAQLGWCRHWQLRCQL